MCFICHKKFPNLSDNSVKSIFHNTGPVAYSDTAYSDTAYSDSWLEGHFESLTVANMWLQ